MNWNNIANNIMGGFTNVSNAVGGAVDSIQNLKNRIATRMRPQRAAPPKQQIQQQPQPRQPSMTSGFSNYYQQLRNMQ